MRRTAGNIREEPDRHGGDGLKRKDGKRQTYLTMDGVLCMYRVKID